MDLNGLVIYDGLPQSQLLRIEPGESRVWPIDVVKITNTQVEVGVVIVEHTHNGVGRRWAENLCRI